MNIAYIRVSTEEQNEARQKEALEQHDIDKFFIEKASGKNTDRPELRKCLTGRGKVILFLSMTYPALPGVQRICWNCWTRWPKKTLLW